MDSFKGMGRGLSILTDVDVISGYSWFGTWFRLLCIRRLSFTIKSLD